MQGLSSILLLFSTSIYDRKLNLKFCFGHENIMLLYNMYTTCGLWILIHVTLSLPTWHHVIKKIIIIYPLVETVQINLTHTPALWGEGENLNDQRM